MSLGSPPLLDLPDGFDSSSSWERAVTEDVTLGRLNRAEWLVQVGGGGRHRVVCATRSGEIVADCDCRGYQHHDWCAHVAAVVRAYVRQDVTLADLDADPEEELDALWRAQGDPREGRL
jgi:uncharacterized Zn finger protein